MAEWTGTGRAYAASFALLCEGMVDPMLDAVGVVRGEPAGGRLLDVGTGSGTVAGAASARGYAVVGVDAEASMLAAARRRHPDVLFSRSTVPPLKFEDGWFDVVTASFVLNHMSEPPRAVAEIARVTAPGGVVAVSTWPAGASPLRPLWEATLGRSGVADYPAGAMSAEALPHRTPRGLSRLLEDGGLERVKATNPEWTFAIDPDDLWLGVAGGVAMIGGIHRSLAVDQREAMHEAYLDVTDDLVDDDGLLHFPHTAILAVGVRPAKS